MSKPADKVVEEDYNGFKLLPDKYDRGRKKQYLVKLQGDIYIRVIKDTSDILKEASTVYSDIGCIKGVIIGEKVRRPDVDDIKIKIYV